MKQKKTSAKGAISANIKKIKTAAKPKRTHAEIHETHSKMVESRKGK
jgi:hypothetical protein